MDIKVNADEFPIPRSNLDPFPRYKMPKLKTTVTGKTELNNLALVANALQRPADCMLQLFGLIDSFSFAKVLWVCLGQRHILQE